MDKSAYDYDYDECVALVAGSFVKQGKYGDEIAMMHLHGVIEYFAAQHGFERVVELVAQIYDEYAELAALERERRSHVLQKKFGC